MKQKGFTLIEIMITVAIVGILAAIAMPIYSNYVFQSYLTEAFNDLSSFSLQMQQYFQDNGTYAASTACGVTPTNSSHFNVTCAITASGFLATATSTNTGGLGAGKYVFTIDNANNQATVTYAGATANSACWWMSQGMSC